MLKLKDSSLNRTKSYKKIGRFNMGVGFISQRDELSLFVLFGPGSILFPESKMTLLSISFQSFNYKRSIFQVSK